jgi:GNAT superfamily N-acetyltransferase
VESIRIRTARSEDLPVLRRIYRRASLANEGDREALLANPDAWVLAADRVAEGRTRVAVTAEGTILGFATGVPVENSTLELEDLFVEPDRVRHGIATRLVADQTEHARRMGSCLSESRPTLTPMPSTAPWALRISGASTLRLGPDRSWSS